MLRKKTKEESKQTHEEKEGINQPATPPESSSENPISSETADQEIQSKPASEPDPAQQLAEINDRYLRLYSEFDNYRKRTSREKIELGKFATSEIITKLLPVLDDFERAIKAFDTTPDTSQALKDGVVLIFNKFFAILSQQGLQPMRAMGEAFDTDFHEAITNIPAPTPEQKGKIVDEIEKGYLLHGKVIRYARVVVGS